MVAPLPESVIGSKADGWYLAMKPTKQVYQSHLLAS